MIAAPNRLKQARTSEGLSTAAPGLPAQRRTERRACASGAGTTREGDEMPSVEAL